MIFIITRKDDVHVDIVAGKLKKMKVDFFRFNTECASEYKITLSTTTTARIANNITNKVLDFKDVRSVWLRRRSFPNVGIDKKFESFIEGEWLHLYRNIWFYLKDVFWVSSPVSIEMARDKLKQLYIARNIGFRIPETIFTNSIKDVVDMQKKYDEIIYKPHDGGSLSNFSDKVIYTSKVDNNLIKSFETEKRLKVCPGIFQPYITKSYELRITVVGSRVFVTKIDSQKSDETKIDWRRYDFKNVSHSVEKLPSMEEQKCIELVKILGLKFGAIDMIVTPNNEYYFLEINANGQWAWIEVLTKQSISSEIANLLVYHTNTDV